MKIHIQSWASEAQTKKPFGCHSHLKDSWGIPAFFHAQRREVLVPRKFLGL